MSRVAILTPQPGLPERSALERALREFELTEARLTAPGRVELGGATITLTAREGPVPNAEADTAAFLSLSAVNGRWRLGRHQAHLELTLDGAMTGRPEGLLGRLSGATRPASALERLARFTRVAAAVSRAVSGLGVHWPGAPVTHAPDFFQQLARESELPLPLWLGVSLTPESGGRSGLVSFGMKQLALPDLHLVGPGGEELPDTIDFFFSALSTIAERGTAPVEGETIPRSLLSRPKVHYGEHPVEQGQRVWRLDL